MKSGIKLIKTGFIEKQLMSFDYEIKRITYLSTKGAKRSPTEIVSNYRVMLFIEGIAEVHISGDVYIVNKGDCVLFTPGSLYNATLLGEGECQFVTVEFNFYNPVHSIEFRELLGIRNISVYPKIIPETTVQFALAAFEAADTPSPLGTYRVRLLLENIIGYIVFRDDNPVTESLKSREHIESEIIVAKTHAYIINNKNKNVKLEDICKELSISRSYMYQCFRKVMKMSAKDFVIKTKMYMAEMDLLQTNKAVDIIAHENGYANQNQFSSIFRKTHGVSPTDYRKINR